MNFEKYRELDTIKLHGISADIFQENEHGELIDPLRGKDADWLTGKSTLAKAEISILNNSFLMKSISILLTI